MKNWPLEVFLGKSLQILVKQCLSKVSGGQFPNSAISHTCFRNLPNNFRHSLHPFVANSFKGNLNSHIALGCTNYMCLPPKETRAPYIWIALETLSHFSSTSIRNLQNPKPKTQLIKPSWWESHPSILLWPTSSLLWQGHEIGISAFTGPQCGGVSQGPDGTCRIPPLVVEVKLGRGWWVFFGWTKRKCHGLLWWIGGMDGELRYETVVFVQTNAMDLGLVHLFWNWWDYNGEPFYPRDRIFEDPNDVVFKARVRIG